MTGAEFAAIIHELNVHTVIANRCLRILNPWAIMANATSIAIQSRS